MYKIWKEFKFSASHQLTGLPPTHQCSRLHGHNYVVEIQLESEVLNEIGFIVDFGDLKIFKDWIDSEFDHRHLNDVLAFNPTAENMAKFICEAWQYKFPQLAEVRVKETDTSWAAYRCR